MPDEQLVHAPPLAPRRSLLRDGASVLGVRLIGLPIMFLVGLVTARWLGADGKGLLAALTAVPYMVISLAEAGVRQSSTQMLGRRVEDRRLVLGSVIWLLVASSALGMLLTGAGYIASGGVSALGGRLPTTLAALAALLVPTLLCVSYMRGVLLGIYRVADMNRIDWLLPVLTLVLTVAFVIGLGTGVAGALMGLVLAAVLTSLYALTLVYRRVRPRLRPERRVMRLLLSRGMVYALALFAVQLNYRADIIVLGRYVSDVQIGIYSVGVNVAEIILQLPGALGTIIFARSAAAPSARPFSLHTARVARLTFIALSLCAVPVALLCRPIVVLLYGDQFSNSADVIQILLPGIVVLGLFKVLTMDIAGRGRPGLTLMVMLPSAVLNIVLNILLVPDHGYVGAAWSSSVTYVLATVAYVVVFSRVTDIPLLDVLRPRRDDFAPLLLAVRRP